MFTQYLMKGFLFLNIIFASQLKSNGNMVIESILSIEFDNDQIVKSINLAPRTERDLNYRAGFETAKRIIEQNLKWWGYYDYSKSLPIIKQVVEKLAEEVIKAKCATFSGTTPNSIAYILRGIIDYMDTFSYIHSSTTNQLVKEIKDEAQFWLSVTAKITVPGKEIVTKNKFTLQLSISNYFYSDNELKIFFSRIDNIESIRNISLRISIATNSNIKEIYKLIEVLNSLSIAKEYSLELVWKLSAADQIIKLIDECKSTNTSLDRVRIVFSFSGPNIPGIRNY